MIITPELVPYTLDIKDITQFLSSSWILAWGLKASRPQLYGANYYTFFKEGRLYFSLFYVFLKILGCGSSGLADMSVLNSVDILRFWFIFLKWSFYSSLSMIVWGGPPGSARIIMSTEEETERGADTLAILVFVLRKLPIFVNPWVRRLNPMSMTT